MIADDDRGQTARLRWLMLGIAWAALLLSCIDRAMWATTAPVAGPDLGMPAAKALGAFVSATQGGYLIALLIGSIATDWIGPRRILAASIIWLGCAAFAFSHIHSLASGLIVQFCIGVGAAPVFAIGMKLITSWFSVEQRATAISIFMTALSVPTMLVNLLVPIGIAYAGWRTNYQLVGFVTAALGIVIALLVRNGPISPSTPDRQPRPSLLPLLKSREYRRLVIANMAGPWASWGFMIWANLLLIDRFHITLAASGRIVASYGLGAFLGLLLVGPISDRIGLDRKRATIACFLIFAAALTLVGTIDNLTLLRIAVPILGFIGYSYGPLLNTMIANTAGPVAASAAGVATLLTFAAEGLQPLLIGALYQQSGSFLLVCCALAAGPLIAALAIATMSRQAA